MDRAERLIKRYKAGDPRALDQLREAVRPYTEAWIRRTSGQGNAAPYPLQIPTVIATRTDSTGACIYTTSDKLKVVNEKRRAAGLPPLVGEIECPATAPMRALRAGRHGIRLARLRAFIYRAVTWRGVILPAIVKVRFPDRPSPVWGGWEKEGSQSLWGPRPKSKFEEWWQEVEDAWQLHQGEDEVVEDREGISWANHAAYNLEDLEEISEAALLEAAATFDPSKGRRFTTWLHDYRSNRFLNMRARDYRKAQKHGPPRMDVIPDEPPEALDLVEGDAPEQAIRWLRLRLQYPAAKKKVLAHALGITPRQGRKYAAFWRERLTAQPLQQDNDWIPKRNAYGIEDPTPWNAGRLLRDPGALIEVGGSYNWTPGPSRRMPHDKIAYNQKALIEAGLCSDATPWRPMTPEERESRFHCTHLPYSGSWRWGSR